MKASMGALARQTPAVLCAAFLVGMRLSAQPTDIQPVQPSRTVILRSASVSATVAVAGAPDLDSLEKYCQGMHCVAHPKGPDEWSALDALAKAGLVTLEEFPEATKVHFAQATFDADTGTFDRDFPGIAETDERSAMGQWTVLLKAFLDPRWRTDFTNAGFVLGESVGPMAYQLYGPQDALDALKAQAPYIARVAPVPFGIKRIRVDDRSKDDQAGAPVPTTVVLFAIDDVPALRLLSQKEDRAPSIIYATGATVAYSVRLTADEALYLSTFAEVIAVERRAALASPSDERSNVVIGGGFQSPDTSWPLQLGPNSTPPRWAGYLSSLASLGIDPARQTIAFLDSGIDSGPLQTCPPALTHPTTGVCSLDLSSGKRSISDITTEFDLSARRANDYLGHGTFTTAVAAGYAPSSGARDSQQYSLVEGVAPGAKIAMSKTMEYLGCPPPGTAFREFHLEPGGGYMYQDDLKVRYSLVTMSRPTTYTSPDGVHGAGVTAPEHGEHGFRSKVSTVSGPR